MHSDADAPTPTGARSSRCTTSCSRSRRRPIVALNRAVAVAEVDGPAAALALVDELDLDGYHLFHAIRADLLRRLGRTEEADRPTPPRPPDAQRDVDAATWRGPVDRVPRSAPQKL